jgi:hypothetical protein
MQDADSNIPLCQNLILPTFADIFILLAGEDMGKMMDRTKLKELSKNLVTDSTDYMAAFRRNLDMYLSQKDISIRSLSEDSDIPFETLKSFVYGDTKDCKLSTAVKLAKALHISVDELIGADTMEDDFRENCSICRNLPENSMYLIDWVVRHQEAIYKKAEQGDRIITVIKAEFQEDGFLRSSGDFDQINISSLPESVKIKSFLGINIACHRYMPTYSPHDILLLANDRDPLWQEDSVILMSENLFVARRFMDDDGIIKYRSIRDRHTMAKESEIENRIGYVSYVIRGAV